MKQDKLETYIRKHREELDDRALPVDLWPQIAAGLEGKKSTGNRLVYWQAAAVIFFVLFMGLLLRHYQPVTGQENYGVADPEFRQTEQYYQEVIQEKETLLSAYLVQYPELAEDFTNDFRELSRNYRQLKADLDKTNSAEVLNALILNLQLQQDLLNQQLKIIQKNEKENNDVSI